MSRRRGHRVSRAGVAGGGTVVFPNIGRRPRDPALPLSTDSDYTAAEGPSGLTPETLAAQLDSFYSGYFADIAKTWEVMERRDGTIAVGRAKRLNKVCRELRNWEVVTFDDSAEAERQAEFLRAFYGRLRARSAIDATEQGGLNVAVRFLCDAIGKQYSFCACRWGGAGEGLTLELTHLPLWFFRRDRDRIELLTQGAASGLPIDPKQWVIANAGRGVMEPCVITALWKRLPVRQLVHILEKWGVPSVYAKTQHTKGSPGWDELMEALQALISGWTGILGGSDTIETIEPRGGSSNLAALQMPWIEYCSREETTLWLHSHLGTRAEGDTGNLAGGAQAADTDDLIASDWEWLQDLFRTQVDARALLYGLGVDTPLAAFKCQKPDALDDDGDLRRMERGVEMGVPIPVSHFRERFSIPEPDGDEPVLVPPAIQGQALPAIRNAAPPAPAQRDVRVLANSLAASIGWRNRNADLDELVANSLQPFGDAYARLLQGLTVAVSAAPNLARAAEAMDAWAPPDADRDALAEEAARFVFAAALMGLEPMRDGVAAVRIDERQATPVPNSAAATLRCAWRRLTGRDASGADVELLANATRAYAPLPFEEARAFWSAKRLITSWADLERLGATWQQARVLGFRIAGLTVEALVRQAHADLDRAIRGEATVEDLVRDLQAKYGLGSRHAEIVVRTNVQSAYQWGHYQQLVAVRADFPVWAFDVVADDRTSDICRPLAGKAFPAEHTIWDSLYPPNHYQCRTTVVALTTDEATEQGFSIETGWPRDPDTGATFMPQHGFEMNVGRVRLDELIA